ncbi:MAG TPA: acyl-CoA dehydrogenase family protein [Kofleriaceae bacterium]|nr:acyl-CoA dehydrogenase family protein [Kofleriaceae bacterium]
MKLSSDDLPMFFTEAHVRLAERLRAAAPAIAAVERPGALADEHARDRAAAAALAEAGLFELVVPRVEGAGACGAISTRDLCLAREMLGYVSPRADSILAVQGLGTHAVGLAGSAEQRAQLPAFARGAQIAAFALTEPEAGSDVAAIATRAMSARGPTGDGYRLDGDKLFISNLGIADHAMVVATVDPALGNAGLTAFWVPLATPGVTVEPLTATAAHPIGALALRGAVVPASARIGEVGQGMKLALATLDAFRVSVGAAAVGMARRALDEALGFVTGRRQFGKLLSEQPLVQAHLADMVVDLDAARLLVLRAAHQKDTTGGKVTTEVSIAKLGATEAAQRVIDRAVQLFGGRGVMAGAVVEVLYRAIRPLRIYEGTSEIQRMIIGRALARQGRAP